MSVLLLVFLLVGTPLTARGVHDLQAWLDRWDHNRHAGK
jgi:hypothetical protein